MKKVNVFFVWGYGSSPESSAVKYLKETLGDDYNVMSDYYAQYNPEEAIIDIENYIKEKNIDILVGSSLGGYITLQIPNIKKVIINPCLHPEIVLPTLTEDVEKKDDKGNIVLDKDGNKIIETVKSVPEHIIKYYSNYISQNDVWNKYNAQEDARTVWVIGKHDELLKDMFVDEVTEHAANVVRSEQGHHNTFESIVEFVVPEIKKMFNTK